MKTGPTHINQPVSMNWFLWFLLRLYPESSALDNGIGTWRHKGCGVLFSLLKAGQSFKWLNLVIICIKELHGVHAMPMRSSVQGMEEVQDFFGVISTALCSQCLVVSLFLNSRAHTHKQPVWWLFYFIDEYQSLSRGKKLLSPFFSAGVNFINCDKVFNKQTLT